MQTPRPDQDVTARCYAFHVAQPGVSQVVLGASKTRRSDFDRRIPAEKNKKSTGSWRDNGMASSVHMPHSMLYEEHERYPTIDIATSRTRQRPNAFAALALGSLHLHELHFDTQFISKRKSAICLLMLVVSDKKHVQKFESSVLLQNTSSLRAMPAKQD